MNVLFLSQNLSGSVYSETMSGGLYGSGADVDLAAHNPAVAPVGVLGGGVATFTYNLLGSTDGPRAGGTSITLVTYSSQASTDGPLSAGSATVTCADFPSVAAAGVLANGGDVTAFDQIVNGGVFGAGSAADPVVYNPSVVPAGVLVAPVAVSPKKNAINQTLIEAGKPTEICLQNRALARITLKGLPPTPIGRAFGYVLARSKR